jgi:hypothetical protein
LFSASYGSDTAVSIVNPFNISGPDNIIRTFGCTKNGFSLVDYATTCSFKLRGFNSPRLASQSAKRSYYGT